MSMSMSVRQKQLTKKVMCSLLAAGVINVCISGGDAWAADYEKTAGESKVIDNADGSKSVVDFGTGGYTWTTNSGKTIWVGGEGGRRTVVGLVGNFTHTKDDLTTTISGTSIYANAAATGSAAAIQARRDKYKDEAAISGGYPVVNVNTSGDVYLKGTEAAVTGQDGIVNIGSEGMFADNVTLVTSGSSAAVYVRNLFGEGVVNVYGNNIEITSDAEAPEKQWALSGNGKGEINIHGKDTVVINGIIESYNTDMQIKGDSLIHININQDAVDTAKVIIKGAEINAADKSEVNIKGASGSSIEANLIARKDKGNDGGSIDINFADGGSLTGNISAINGGFIKLAGNITYQGSAAVNKGTLDISKVNNLTLTGVTANADEAVIKVTNGGTLAVNENGKLGINDLKTAGTYKIVSVDANSTANFWKEENLAYDRTSMFAEVKQNNRDYDVVYKELKDLSVDEKEAAKEQIVAAAGGTSLAATSVIGSIVTDSDAVAKSAPGAKAFVAAVTGSADITSAQAAAHINAAVQMGETSGTSANAVSVASNVTGTVTGRMSLNAAPVAEVGGKGRSLYEDNSGAGIWAQYVHGKDKVRDMAMAGGSASYDSKYNGFVLGTDFAKIGKFQSGIAFTYGSGDTTSVGGAAYSRNDFDFWGVSLYGSMRNSDTNLIADIGYSRSDSDVEQNNFGSLLTANPKTDTITLGIKGEKLYQYDNLQVMPYVGLRYLSIDTGSYSSDIGGLAAFNYVPERQNIWLLPVGVSLTYENIADNGWKIRPNVNLSYMWAMGDTDSSMTVGLPGTTAADRLGYTVMDKGSFIGKVGLEAEKGHMMYGVSYSYQKGSDAQSNKWFVDLKYSF